MPEVSTLLSLWNNLITQDGFGVTKSFLEGLDIHMSQSNCAACTVRIFASNLADKL